MFVSQKMIDFTKRFCCGFVGGIVGHYPCKFLAEGIVCRSRFGRVNVEDCHKGPSLNDPSLAVQRECFRMSIESSINEEIFFRGIIQGTLLYKMPFAITQRLLPNKSWIFHSPLARWVRIISVSSLFAYAHQDNTFSSLNETKVVHAFFLGAGLGIIKESSLKLSGSIGAHIASNCVGLIPLFTTKNK